MISDNSTKKACKVIIENLCFIQTITGDTIVTSRQVAGAAKREFLKSSPVQSTPSVATHDNDHDHGHGHEEESDDHHQVEVPVLAGLAVPDPVFFCSIEPPSMSFQKKLDHALECLTKEDPSLRVHVDKETGETIIAGMGELHLDIIKDRIKKEYGVEVYLGSLQIAYKETIDKAATNQVNFDTTIGDTRHQVTICVSVHPCEDDKHGELGIVPHNNSSLAEASKLGRRLWKAIANGVNSALNRGELSEILNHKIMHFKNFVWINKIHIMFR